MTRTIDKRRAVDQADAAGLVVDSLAVRRALMERVRAGEITLEAAKIELKAIKRGGVTRASVWRSA